MPVWLEINLESTYDWNANQWNIPVNAIVAQMFKIGDQPIQPSAGARYYAETPAGGPEWGLRLALTFLFHKS